MSGDILDCHDLEWTEARDSAKQYTLLNRGHPVHQPQQQRLTQAKMSVVPRQRIPGLDQNDV